MVCVCFYAENGASYTIDGNMVMQKQEKLVE